MVPNFIFFYSHKIKRFLKKPVELSKKKKKKKKKKEAGPVPETLGLWRCLVYRGASELTAEAFSVGPLAMEQTYGKEVLLSASRCEPESAQSVYGRVSGSWDAHCLGSGISL